MSTHAPQGQHTFVAFKAINTQSRQIYNYLFLYQKESRKKQGPQSQFK